MGTARAAPNPVSARGRPAQAIRVSATSRVIKAAGGAIIEDGTNTNVKAQKVLPRTVTLGPLGTKRLRARQDAGL